MRVNGLFGWVKHNDARATALVFGFILIVQAMAAITLLMPLAYIDPEHAPFYFWGAYAARYVPGIALASAGFFAIGMGWHVRFVGSTMVLRYVDNADEPRLCGLVEPLAITAGMPNPFVAVVEDPALNAFACGITRKGAALVFTRGLIDGLDDDELSGVIAHELTHIRNGDIRLLAAANVFMLSLGLANRVNLWRIRSYKQVAIVALLPLLLPLFVGMSIMSALLLRLGFASRLLISASREFVADAEAVRLTHNPAAFISALNKIQGKSVVYGLTQEADAMMIDGASSGALATHPTIAERITALTALVGPLAFDRASRRDTRPLAVGASRAGFGRRSILKVCDSDTPAALPSTHDSSSLLLSSIWRVGEDGKLAVLGMRWNLAIAVFATFCVSLALHQGNMGSYLFQMGSFYRKPSDDAMWFVRNANNCRDAELKSASGLKADLSACNVTPEFAERAKKLGIHVEVFGVSDAQRAKQLAEARSR